MTRKRLVPEVHVENVTRVVNVDTCCDGYQSVDNDTDCAPVCSEGCSHGHCSQPFTCSCDAGYGGLNCDIKVVTSLEAPLLIIFFRRFVPLAPGEKAAARSVSVRMVAIVESQMEHARVCQDTREPHAMRRVQVGAGVLGAVASVPVMTRGTHVTM